MSESKLVRVELHHEDGRKIIFTGEALALWMKANDTVASFWSIHGFGTAGYTQAFALAEKLSAPETSK